MKLSTKKINKVAIVSLVFFAILFVFFANPKKSSATSCTVEYARWVVPGHPNISAKLPAGWYTDATPPPVQIDVVLNGCAGQKAEISIVESDGYTTSTDDDIAELDDMEITVPDNSNHYEFFINLTAGETECERSNEGEPNPGPECDYYIKIDLVGYGNNWSSYNNTSGKLQYDCEGTSLYKCNQNWAFGSVPTTGHTGTATDCTIVSAGFGAAGQQVDGWFKADKAPEVFLVIKTKKCEGERVEISIVENGILWDTRISELDSIPKVIDNKYTDTNGINTTTIKLLAGNTNCANEQIPDCQYYITVNPPGWSTEFSTKGKGGTGELSYNCDQHPCKFVNWSYVGISGSINGVILPSTPPVQDLRATGQYDLLAPLPGLEKTFNIKEEGSLQKYIGIIFALLIGLAGLLAVVMIVIGGIEYMSTDAIQGKEEGKERVTQAIIGLLLALGAWLIINTINPNLLTLQFGMTNVGIVDNGGGGGGNGGAGGVPLDDNPGCPNINWPHLASYSKYANGPVWTADDGVDPNVQKNLDKLKPEFDKLVAAITAAGGSVNVSSVYRSFSYQSHFYELKTLRDTYNNDPTFKTKCPKTYAYTTSEIASHGIQGQVSVPNNGPHVQGYAFDINITGITVQAADNLAASNNFGVRWAHLSNDIPHWELSPNLRLPVDTTIGASSNNSSNLCTQEKQITCNYAAVAGDTNKPGCASFVPFINQYASSDSDRNFLKTWLVEESACEFNGARTDTMINGSTATSYGPFQFLPATANSYKTACSVSGNIDAAWLQNPANADKSVCLAVQMLNDLKSSCGNTTRHLFAALAGGPGACSDSLSCSGETSCTGTSVKKYECPWDDTAHTIPNTGFAFTRAPNGSVAKQMYCYNHPGF